MVDGRRVADIVSRETADAQNVLCVVELAQSMPQQKGVFNYGSSFGILIGVLDTLRMPYLFVRPTAWKKQLNLGADKALSISMATRMWPDADIGKKDGRAEALLLAHWAGREREGMVNEQA
jgi:hypothetical protein